MNTVLTYLNNNWQRLRLDRFGTPAGLSSVMLTPGFRASSHLIFFVLKAGYDQPILVIKLPRLAGDHGRLDKEVENLRKLHGMQEGGFDSIPRVVAYEDCSGHKLLVETMVKGEVMRRSLVKRKTDNCIFTVLEWLDKISKASVVSSEQVPNWFEELVESRLRILENGWPLSDRERVFLDRTRELVAPLRDERLPLVFEHGDFSAPNILIEEKSGLGVVDWELAEPLGIPAADLFFFLSYVAFSRSGAEEPGDYLKAFQEAFFLPKGWTKPYVLHYGELLKISPDLLKPLFVLSWSRYLAHTVARLKGSGNGGNMLAEETVSWLRGNRYYQIWQHTVENSDRLIF